MGELSKLINIGITLEKQLNQIGIYTEAELKKTGAEQAWMKIKKVDKSACINKLLALEGAVKGIKKTFLPEERKNELKEFYKGIK